MIAFLNNFANSQPWMLWWKLAYLSLMLQNSCALYLHCLKCFYLICTSWPLIAAQMWVCLFLSNSLVSQIDTKCRKKFANPICGNTKCADWYHSSDKHSYMVHCSFMRTISTPPPSSLCWVCLMSQMWSKCVLFFRSFTDTNCIEYKAYKVSTNCVTSGALYTNTNTRVWLFWNEYWRLVFVITFLKQNT